MTTDLQPAPVTIAVTTSRYIRPCLAPAVIGLTAKAVQGKIDSGVWLEGREFIKGADNLIYISLDGFEKWVKTKGKR